MRRLAALAAALLLLLAGCNSKPVAVKPTEPAVVSAEIVSVTKDSAKVSTTVIWQGKASGYGWVLYDVNGGFISSGESQKPEFTVEKLEPGTRYLLSVWAAAGDDRVLCNNQLAFETGFRYDRVLANGIDVSRWQGNINWTAVAADKVDFAILRLGYSGGTDKKFEEYYSGATAAGIDIGVYIYSYATTVEQARQDALYTLSVLNGRELDYPVYYDIEDDSVIGLDSDTVTQIARAFCDTIRQNSDYSAGIYTAVSMFNDRMRGNELAKDYETWIAFTTADPPTESNYAMVQYTHKGSVKGIGGNVDRNVLFKKP